MCDELRSILSETDRLVDNFLHPKQWHGTLPLDMCRICRKDELYENVQSESIDLFDYCKGGRKSLMYSKSDVVRFDRNKYPIPEKENDAFDKASSGYKLITDLLSVCRSHGKSLYLSNGTTNGNKNNRRISCHHQRCSNPSSEGKVYKDLALRKSKSNPSIETSRRTSSSRASDISARCNAFFVICYDHISFYMMINTGIGLHSNHAPHDCSAVIFPKRLVPADVLANLHKYSFCKVSMGSIVLLSRESDCYVTDRQMRNMAGFAKLANAIHEVDNVPKGKLSGPDQMIAFFHDSKIPHIVLSHHKDTCPNELKTTSTVGSNMKDETTGFIAMECDGVTESSLPSSDQEFLPDSEMKSMIEYSNESRSSLRVPHDQSIMLSFMWSAQHCRRLFQAFPEVLYIDGTHGTNSERMPLLTVGIRDHNFKMNVVIRAFIPNERAWLFRWIFRHGIPTLLGKDACKRVRLIVTDGDSQETSQLDNAISSKIYGDAKRRRCGWHIIEKGATKHLRHLCRGKEKQNVVAIVKLWLQESLMKNVESMYEYNRYVFMQSHNLEDAPRS